MATKAEREAEKVDAREWFATHCPPGSTVYTILDHVSRSGMLRRVRVVVPVSMNGHGVDFFHPNHSAAILTGYRQEARDAHRGDGLRVGGCGFDAGFEVVSSIAHAVYPDGFGCIGEGCPSNDHSNSDRDYTPNEPHTASHWHKVGAYAFRHRWL